MMNKVVSLLVATALLQLTGCMARKRGTGWEKDNTYRVIIRQRLRATETATQKAGMNWLDEYDRFLESDASPQAKRDRRNGMIEYYINLVDEHYSKFEHDLHKGRAVFSSVGDFVNLGLTAATAVGAGASELLGAAATGSQGAQHSLEKNFFDAQTRFVIANRMNALRKEQLLTIRSSEEKPAVCGASATDCYPIEQAMNDVQEYYERGTVHRALQDINLGSAQQAKTAETKLESLKHLSMPDDSNTPRR